MFASIPVISLLALTTSVAAQGGNILYGGQCCYEGFLHCENQGAMGCIQINGGGPNCVNQTPYCDNSCTRFAYQKDNSNDRRCVCSEQDASEPTGYC